MLETYGVKLTPIRISSKDITLLDYPCLVVYQQYPILTKSITSFIKAGMSGYPRMGYLPYIFRGLSYGEQITLNDAKIYSPMLIKKGGIEMFNTKSVSQWHKPLGSDVTKILHSDFFDSPTFNGNTDIIKLYEVIEKNSLPKLDAPKTAVKLYHSQADDFVLYSNATAARNKWSNATLTDLTSSEHIQAGLEFLFRYINLWEMIAPKQ